MLEEDSDLSQARRQQRYEHLLPRNAPVTTSKLVLPWRPPEIRFVRGHGDPIPHTFKRSYIGLSRAEQTLMQGIRTGDKLEAARPGSMDVLAHGFGLSGLNVEIRQTMLPRRKHMQPSRQRAVVCKVETRVIRRVDLAVVRQEQEKSASLSGRRQILRQKFTDRLHDSLECCMGLPRSRPKSMSKRIHRTKVDPDEPPSTRGVLHELGDARPQIRQTQVPVHIDLLEVHPGKR